MSYPQIWCHIPTLSLEISEIFNIFYFSLTFSYHWDILYEPHCQQCWVKFTHAGHVILQLILYKLWSKMSLWAPLNCQFWHHSCIWLNELPPNLASHPYLIFRKKWDIQYFLFFLTFSYHWEILYEPHCQQCWVKFTHAGHVILQLILYMLWSKMSLWAFQPYKLPILTSQLCPAQWATPKFGVTSLPYL